MLGRVLSLSFDKIARCWWNVARYIILTPFFWESAGGFEFKDAGVGISVVSSGEVQRLINPKSDKPGGQTDAIVRFKKNPAGQQVTDAYDALHAGDAKYQAVLGRHTGGGHGV
jgi:hypothetical protein